MICVTGDIHADLSRFQNRKIKKLKKDDYLIVCGDFGFLWDGSKREEKILKQLGRKKYHILFVDGCHENYDLLNKYEVSDWNGGKVRVISGKLMQLVRGSVFQLGDTRIFAFGGGLSTDKDIRQETGTWWKDELPTAEEIRIGTENLKKHDGIVDYIITHETPSSLKEFLSIDTDQMSELHTFFNYVQENCRFKRWFFGKCHKNKTIPTKFQAIFDEVMILR